MHMMGPIVQGLSGWIFSLDSELCSSLYLSHDFSCHSSLELLSCSFQVAVRSK